MIDAVLTAENCTFAGNNASYLGGATGGAIDAQTSVVTLDSCEFLNNTADFGGGLYLLDSTLQISNSTFAGNFASAFGGAFEFSESNASLSGNVVIEGNQATGEGGGIMLSSSKMEIQADGRLVLEANEAGRGGGGGYILSSELEVLLGGQVMLADNNAGSGGGMYVQSSPELQIESTWFTSNRANTTGGAMSLFSVGTLDTSAGISDCSFVDNEAGDIGGAVFIVSGYVNVIDSEFDGNTAGKQPPGI